MICDNRKVVLDGLQPRIRLILDCEFSAQARHELQPLHSQQQAPMMLTTCLIQLSLYIGRVILTSVSCSCACSLCGERVPTPPFSTTRLSSILTSAYVVLSKGLWSERK